VPIDLSQVEWYRRSRGSSADIGPSVAIGKSGRLTLNEEAIKLFGETPEAMQVGLIMGARGKATLVLQAAKKSDEGSLALAPAGRKFGLNTSKYFKDKGLEKVFNTTYTKPEFDSEHRVLVVSL
jgi:hypothetical protein